VVKTITPNDITVDEAIALLKRTSLPTIVVEGQDDIIVYRKFEKFLEHLNVSTLPVGGRQKVLEIFKRRHEIGLSVKIMFIADLDTWVYTGVPPFFHNDDFIFTDGYSIENDIYFDGRLWNLLEKEEEKNYQDDIKNFIEWYALALSRHLIDRSHSISHHSNHVLGPERQFLLTLEHGEKYPNELKNDVLSAYQRLLRGKSLMDILLRQINRTGRDARHNSAALFEIVAVNPSTLLNKMITKVAERLNIA
jgi:hypothetical protein